MDIKIPEAQMQDIVAQAIFKTLDDNARNTIIQDAITHLISKPEKRNYYDAEPRSRLQEAFHNAVAAVANKIIHQQIESDSEVKVKITALFNDAMMKVFEEGNREVLVGRLANAIGSAIAKE